MQTSSFFFFFFFLPHFKSVLRLEPSESDGAFNTSIPMSLLVLTPELTLNLIPKKPDAILSPPQALGPGLFGSKYIPTALCNLVVAFSILLFTLRKQGRGSASVPVKFYGYH